MASPTLRSFIAVPLPKEVQLYLGSIQGQIRTRNRIHASLPRTDNLHITLFFLGNIPFHSIAPVSSALDAAVQEESPFALSLSNLGTFPRFPRPARVLWAGLQGDLNVLKRIYGKLAEKLSYGGVIVHRQKFSPHITLARFKKPPHNRFIEEISSQPDVPGGTFQVNEVHLYKSELTPRGAVYSLVHTSRLD